MEKLKIVPSLINKLPEKIIQIDYGSNRVQLGNELTVKQVYKCPKISWEVEEDYKRSYYTLCLIDPDATGGAFNHWLVVNIPGLDVDRGETIFSYIGAGPPRRTGLHRYIFFLYKQSNGNQEFTGLVRSRGLNISARRFFSIKEFANTHSLGDPIAGNYFLTQFSPYVYMLYSSIVFRSICPCF